MRDRSTDNRGWEERKMGGAYRCFIERVGDVERKKKEKKSIPRVISLRWITAGRDENLGRRPRELITPRNEKVMIPLGYDPLR